MALTDEQELAVHTYKQDNCLILLLDSIAGSGKSHTLLSIAALPYIKSGLCIVYNKSVSDENKIAFPPSFHSATIHSFAYGYTVKAFGLKVGFFNARDVKESIRYEQKIAVVDALRQFCLSRHLKVVDFIEEAGFTELVGDLVTVYMKKMKDGVIEVTHDFYLKYFHMLLAKNIIQLPYYDSLMIDECQDSFACTIEIFRLIKAEKKVAVGDMEQALYSFNNCINGFDVLRDDPGVQSVNLTRTFRVNDDDAQLVEKFMQDNLERPYSFRGNTYEDKTIKTRAYLTKTNAALIGKMIDLMETGRGFNLLRPAKSIFELPLILLNLKEGGFINNPEYRYLQDDVNFWYRSTRLQAQHSTPLKYIASEHNTEIAVMTAVRTIMKYGPGKIFKAFNHAKNHQSEKNHEWTLSTVFTSKGFTFDYVEIADDMNIAFTKAKSDYLQDKLSLSGFRDILYQYYVISTRHRFVIENAIHLDPHTAPIIGDRVFEDRIHDIVEHENREVTRIIDSRDDEF